MTAGPFAINIFGHYAGFTSPKIFHAHIGHLQQAVQVTSCGEGSQTGDGSTLG